VLPARYKNPPSARKTTFLDSAEIPFHSYANSVQPHITLSSFRPNAETAVAFKELRPPFLCFADW
jgi:hypothetical protein